MESPSAQILDNNLGVDENLSQGNAPVKPVRSFEQSYKYVPYIVNSKVGSDRSNFPQLRSGFSIGTCFSSYHSSQKIENTTNGVCTWQQVILPRLHVLLEIEHTVQNLRLNAKDYPILNQFCCSAEVGNMQYKIGYLFVRQGFPYQDLSLKVSFQVLIYIQVLSDISCEVVKNVWCAGGYIGLTGGYRAARLLRCP